jgi:hypothetical protein
MKAKPEYHAQVNERVVSEKESSEDAIFPEILEHDGRPALREPYCACTPVPFYPIIWADGYE